MIKYAKIINVQTGLCEVGLGTNADFYESIGMEELDVQQSDVDNKWYLAEKCPMKTEEEKQAKEQERIQELYMSKSDFFDGTIKAFGADKNDLQPAIDAILKTLPIDNIEKKVALNNFENAQNYYRKHSLFALLSDVEIPINETLTIKISSKQWDNFFDKTSKGDKEAYKALIN